MSENRHVRTRGLTLGSPWRWLSALIAGTLALAAAFVGAPAVAAPVYQIEGSWAPGTPATVKASMTSVEPVKSSP